MSHNRDIRGGHRDRRVGGAYEREREVAERLKRE